MNTSYIPSLALKYIVYQTETEQTLIGDVLDFVPVIRSFTVSARMWTVPYYWWPFHIILGVLLSDPR